MTAVLAAAAMAALSRIPAAAVRTTRREGLVGTEELPAVDVHGDGRQSGAQKGRHDKKLEASP